MLIRKFQRWRSTHVAALRAKFRDKCVAPAPRVRRGRAFGHLALTAAVDCIIRSG
jgi:hypothetical protein